MLWVISFSVIWIIPVSALSADNAGARYLARETSVHITKLEMLQSNDSSWQLADVLDGRAGLFKPAQRMEVGNSHMGGATWARVTIRASERLTSRSQTTPNILELPKHYLDLIRLFTPSLGDASLATSWETQEAGDTLPPSKWSISGVFPRFSLPTADLIRSGGKDTMVLYLQIVHNASFSVKLEVMSAEQAATLSQNRFLSSGLILGTMLMSLVMIGCLTWLYRDVVYVWYCVYAMLAGLACASHLGIAQQVLWPVGGTWPSFATQVFLLLATASQLQFCLVAFVQPDRKLWVISTSHVLSGLCLLTALAYIFRPDAWLIWSVATAVLPVLSMMIVLVSVKISIAVGNHLAKAWVAAFFPLLLTVLYGLIEASGIGDFPYIDYQFPVYAAGAEVLVLGLALQWFARERYGEKERLSALASTDPLTGFTNAQSFHQQLQKAWATKANATQDTAIAYVALHNTTNDLLQLKQLQLRSVRVLRTATRNQDTVARLDDSTFALLMPGLTLGEELTQRLSRIIALGLMPDYDESQGHRMQFRVAHTTLQHYQHDLSQLDNDLRGLLAKGERWDSRPIRVIDHLRQSRSSQPQLIDTSALNDLWEEALVQQSLSSPNANATTKF